MEISLFLIYLKIQLNSIIFQDGMLKVKLLRLIAKASHLNKWWPKSTSQVLTLDDGQNAEIEHKFKI